MSERPVIDLMNELLPAPVTPMTAKTNWFFDMATDGVDRLADLVGGEEVESRLWVSDWLCRGLRLCLAAAALVVGALAERPGPLYWHRTMTTKIKYSRRAIHWTIILLGVSMTHSDCLRLLPSNAESTSIWLLN